MYECRECGVWAEYDDFELDETHAFIELCTDCHIEYEEECELLSE